MFSSLVSLLRMFHFKENNSITVNDKSRISQAFTKYSSDIENGLNKTDYKVTWLFLFGYKPSKVF